MRTGEAHSFLLFYQSTWHHPIGWPCQQAAHRWRLDPALPGSGYQLPAQTNRPITSQDPKVRYWWRYHEWDTLQSRAGWAAPHLVRIRMTKHSKKRAHMCIPERITRICLFPCTHVCLRMEVYECETWPLSSNDKYLPPREEEREWEWELERATMGTTNTCTRILLFYFNADSLGM